MALKEKVKQCEQKDAIVNNMQGLLQSKESLIEKLGEDSRIHVQRSDKLLAEKKQYLVKIDQMLEEQKMQKEKDQSVFKNYTAHRQQIQQQLQERDNEISQKNLQIVSMGQSIQELQLMVSSLKGLASVKQDILDSNELMKKQLMTSELQISVLKKEVDTVADFLIANNNNTSQEYNHSQQRSTPNLAEDIKGTPSSTTPTSNPHIL